VLNSWRKLQHQQGMHNPAGGAGAGLIGGCRGRGGRDGRHQAAPPMPCAVATETQGGRVFRCSFCSRGGRTFAAQGNSMQQCGMFQLFLLFHGTVREQSWNNPDPLRRKGGTKITIHFCFMYGGQPIGFRRWMPCPR
jgi:hypothetical protein